MDQHNQNIEVEKLRDRCYSFSLSGNPAIFAAKHRPFSGQYAPSMTSVLASVARLVSSKPTYTQAIQICDASSIAVTHDHGQSKRTGGQLRMTS
jgi:hypothetical protein